jgi:hypothetical protein
MFATTALPHLARMQCRVGHPNGSRQCFGEPRPPFHFDFRGASPNLPRIQIQICRESKSALSMWGAENSVCAGAQHVHVCPSLHLVTPARVGAAHLLGFRWSPARRCSTYLRKIPPHPSESHAHQYISISRLLIKKYLPIISRSDSLILPTIVELCPPKEHAQMHILPHPTLTAVRHNVITFRRSQADLVTPGSTPKRQPAPTQTCNRNLTQLQNSWT